MRRTLTIVLGSAAALATAAVAFAVVPTVSGVTEATATFENATLEKSKTRSCTAGDRKWEITDGHYTGTVVSTNVVLDGSLKIHARTTYNTTDALGYVSGSFKIKDDDSRVKGTFSGTIKGGQLVGFLTGKSHGNHARVLGNLSATFAGGTTNFTDGKIGTGSSANVLAVVAGPVCKGEKHEKSEKSEKSEKALRVEVKGEIAAIETAPATITVEGKDGSKTCNVDAAYAIPDGFPVGTKDVEMKCEAIGNPAQWTLRKLEKDS